MKYKKCLSVLISVSLISVCLSGCSGSSGTSDSTSASGSADSNSTVNLKGYFIGASPSDLDMVFEQANQYSSDKIGVTMSPTFVDYGDYNQKLSMIVNSGEDYDIMFTCAWAGNYSINARNGAYLALDDYLQGDYNDLYSTIDPRFWDGSKVDGKIYAVPTQKEIASDRMFVFNKELVDKYNFDYQSVKTFADLEPFLAEIKANEPGVVPLHLSDTVCWEGNYDMPTDLPLAVTVDGPDVGKVNFTWDLPDYVDYANTAYDFFQKGYINPDASTSNGSFENGDLFGVSIADGQPGADVAWSADCGFPVVTTDMVTPLVTTSSTRGAMLGINAYTKYPTQCMDWLQLVNTDGTFHNILNYGIEGTHYTLDDQGEAVKTEQGTNNYNVATFDFGNLFNTYVLSGNPPDLWQEFQDFNTSAETSPLLGFDFDNTSVTDQIAACENVVLQYNPLISTGSADPATEIPEYHDKLVANGFNDIADELQSQINTFLGK